MQQVMLVGRHRGVAPSGQEDAAGGGVAEALIDGALALLKEGPGLQKLVSQGAQHLLKSLVAWIGAKLFAATAIPTWLAPILTLATARLGR